jgi:hypothetical protein
MNATRVDQQNIAAVRAVESTLGGCQIIGSYRSSLPEYAISFGSSYSGGVHSGTLKKLYPTTIMYVPFVQKFFYFGRFLNPNDIGDRVLARQCVLVEESRIGDVARQDPFHGEIRFTSLITSENPILPLDATVLYKLDPADRP